MTWQEFHRQSQVLHAVIEHVERAGDGRLPWEKVPAAAEVFGTPEGLLLALHQRWEMMLDSRLDQALEYDTHHAPTTVVQTWSRLAAEYPGLRRLLDNSATDPALVAASRQEYRLLAVAAGLATMAEPRDRAAETGLRMIEAWRAGEDRARVNGTRQEQVEERAMVPTRRRSWWSRIVTPPA
jgi:hypothetical protein